MKKILETDRLYLREMTDADYPSLCKMLRDTDVMYAYAHAFSAEEAWEWLRRQQQRYQEDGFGLWAAVQKKTDEMIGQCGITWQVWDDKRVPEIGYLFCKDFWHQGYATEAAVACKKYAFQTLGFESVFSIIRENNLPSIRVAERNGMTLCGRMIKHYYGMDMPHLVFSVKQV